MAFPTTSVLDNFTGTDGTDLPVYSANWTTPANVVSLEIQGNAATGTSTSGNQVNYWNVSNFGPNSEAYCTVATVPNVNRSVAVGVRNVQETDAATLDGYWLAISKLAGTDNYLIRRIDNGVATTLGADFAQEVSNGDSIGLEVVTSTLTAYYKAAAGGWTSLGTRGDSTYSAAGKILIFCDNNVGRFDAFGGGTIATGGVVSKPDYLMLLGVS